MFHLLFIGVCVDEEMELVRGNRMSRLGGSFDRSLTAPLIIGCERTTRIHFSKQKKFQTFIPRADFQRMQRPEQLTRRRDSLP